MRQTLCFMLCCALICAAATAACPPQPPVRTAWWGLLCPWLWGAPEEGEITFSWPVLRRVVRFISAVG